MSPDLQAKPRALIEVRALTADELKTLNSQILRLENQNYWSPTDVRHLDRLKKRRRELKERLAICDGEN